MARLILLAVLASLLGPSFAEPPGARSAEPCEPAPVPVPLPAPVGTCTVGEAANTVLDAVIPQAENETGENLTAENVDLAVRIEVTNAEFDLLGILFGGGKVQSDFRVVGHFEFRAISLSRIEPLLVAAFPGQNVSLATLGFNTSRSVVTAEEFRLLAGAALLAAFEEAEAAAAENLIEESMPGVVVLATRVEWSNIAPAQALRDEPTEPRVDLTEPPLTLDVRMELRFLDRVAIGDLIGKVAEKKAKEAETGVKDPKTLLKERIKENQTVPPLERSAFLIAGIDQLLATQVSPGWRLNLTFVVPRGFTIEGATDELVVTKDKRGATYFADGSQAFTPLEAGSVITLSSRALVVLACLVATLLVGLLLRVLVETGWRFASRGRGRAVPVGGREASEIPVAAPARR